MIDLERIEYAEVPTRSDMRKFSATLSIRAFDSISRDDDDCLDLSKMNDGLRARIWDVAYGDLHKDLMAVRDRLMQSSSVAEKREVERLFRDVLAKTKPIGRV